MAVFSDPSLTAQRAAAVSARGRFGGDCGEVELQPVLLGVADERPVRGETPAVAVAELVEDDAAHLADAGRHLEEFDEILRG